jgi:hypothetical protein
MDRLQQRIGRRIGAPRMIAGSQVGSHYRPTWPFSEWTTAIVADHLDAAVAFFTELGMELECKGQVEGRWAADEP